VRIAAEILSREEIDQRSSIMNNQLKQPFLEYAAEMSLIYLSISFTAVICSWQVNAIKELLILKLNPQ